jgi:hypothetical protein
MKILETNLKIEQLFNILNLSLSYLISLSSFKRVQANRCYLPEPVFRLI